ncbi:MAG: hypothetical protein NTW44_04935 [Nitrospirae bacterium]|nr:hypothetical protein [Nitrospirota bacterium]
MDKEFNIKKPIWVVVLFIFIAGIGLMSGCATERSNLYQDPEQQQYQDPEQQQYQGPVKKLKR